MSVDLREVRDCIIEECEKSTFVPDVNLMVLEFLYVICKL